MSDVKGLVNGLKKAQEAARGVPRSMDASIAEIAAKKVPFGVSISIEKTAKGSRVTYSSDRINRGALSQMVRARSKRFDAAAREAASKPSAPLPA